MQYGLPIARFYRVLFVEPGNHMLNNWNDGRFLSCHEVRHPEWDGIWNHTQSTIWQDYPLKYSAGFYAWEARLAYLSSVQQHAGLNGWSVDEDRNARQIVGVPAFQCPLAALRYAELAESVASPFIVTFDGIFIWNLPEDSGVQALVVSQIGDLAPIEEFRAALGIPDVQQDEEGEIELPFDDA